ncbi:MAG: CDP-glycerol glycerophosphotransferase family protein [Candidatus Neomarinimicrobiota bacterium]
MEIQFFAHHLYYLPQFLAVARACPPDWTISFALSSLATGDEMAIVRAEIERHGWRLVTGEQLRLGDHRPQVLIIGQSRGAEVLAGPDTTVVLLYHGIGVKRVYYADTSSRVDLRFVESDFRRDQCLAASPETETTAVGFAKLDPLLSDKPPTDYPLPTGSGPRILYAPTFYPGSIEILAGLIPIWPADWQIVIKPHQFTYTNPYYHYQVRLLKRLVHESPNVTLLPLAAYNVISAYHWADVLVSEASSTIIEFTALDKPIVVCDELHLRLHHRLWRSRFFHRRMDTDLIDMLDFAHHAVKGVDVASQIAGALAGPETLENQRRTARDRFLGPTDGHAAQRIVQALQARVA